MSAPALRQRWTRLKAPVPHVLALDGTNYLSKPLGSMCQKDMPEGRVLVQSLVQTPPTDLTPDQWTHIPDLQRASRLTPLTPTLPRDSLSVFPSPPRMKM